jgi:hypothetical protein
MRLNYLILPTKRRFMRIIISVFFVLFSAGIFAQDEPKSVSKRKEQLEKQDETKKKVADDAHQQALEKHMKIQTKETKKRMKKSQKKSKRINNNKNEFFLVRWFS